MELMDWKIAIPSNARLGLGVRVPDKNIQTVVGGDTRFQSVKNGLNLIKNPNDMISYYIIYDTVNGYTID